MPAAEIDRLPRATAAAADVSLGAGDLRFAESRERCVTVSEVVVGWQTPGIIAVMWRRRYE